MTDIRKSLETLADAIEAIGNKPAPELVINDRSLSGNKINGGKITNFSSVGIADKSTKQNLLLNDKGLFVDAVVTAQISGSPTVKGDLTVDGRLVVKTLHIEELTEDSRQTRSDNLEFKVEEGVAFNKGLVWPGGSYTKQLMLKPGPDRIYISEDVDIPKEKSYRIHNVPVLTKDSLGDSIVHSSLRTVGRIENLETQGSLNVDDHIYYNPNTGYLGIGTPTPNGDFSIVSLDKEFVIKGRVENLWQMGSHTSASLEIITDGRPRISVQGTGQIVMQEKTVFEKELTVGVTHSLGDTSITTAGPIRFQEKKFEVGSNQPTSGSYRTGDIVWNENPKPTGYVGWICISGGTPGQWKPWGIISQ